MFCFQAGHPCQCVLAFKSEFCWIMTVANERVVLNQDWYCDYRATSLAGLEWLAKAAVCILQATSSSSSISSMEPNPGSAVAAKFDLETPPGSATAADAAANTDFADDEGGPFTKDVNDNLATISLDTPSASDGDAAFQEQPSDHGPSQPAAAPELLPAAAASSGSSLLPLSSNLSSFRGSEQVSEAVLVGSMPSGAVATAEAPASHSQPLPEPQPANAFPVKVSDQRSCSDNIVAMQDTKPTLTSGP
jgi:hypothetical protein